MDKVERMLERLEERLEEMDQATELLVETTEEKTRWELAFGELAGLTNAPAELLMQIKAKFKLE